MSNFSCTCKTVTTFVPCGEQDVPMLDVVVCESCNYIDTMSDLMDRAAAERQSQDQLSH